MLEKILKNLNKILRDLCLQVLVFRKFWDISNFANINSSNVIFQEYFQLIKIYFLIYLQMTVSGGLI